MAGSGSPNVDEIENDFDNFAYDIAEHLGITKTQVLKETPLRDLPLIIHRINQRKLSAAYDTLIQHKLTFDMMTATAGMIPNVEMIKAIDHNLNQSLTMFGPTTEVSKENTDQTYQYDELMKFQQRLSAAHKGVKL